MGVLVDIAISNAIRIEADVWIDAASQCIGFVEPDDLKWCRCSGIQAELTRQWQYIENTASARW